MTFSAPLLMAILAGRKTQTRRPIRPAAARLVDGLPVEEDNVLVPCPWAPGDVLWVREAWAATRSGCERHFAYARDRGEAHRRTRWTSARFMPREAARVFLRVMSVSAERLSTIDEADALAEGFEPMPLGGIGARDVFLSTWDSFYGDGEFAAVHDPLVWRVTFSLENEKNARRV